MSNRILKSIFGTREVASAKGFTRRENFSSCGKLARIS